MSIRKAKLSHKPATLTGISLFAVGLLLSLLNVVYGRWLVCIGILVLLATLWNWYAHKTGKLPTIKETKEIANE